MRNTRILYCLIAAPILWLGYCVGDSRPAADAQSPTVAPSLHSSLSPGSYASGPDILLIADTESAAPNEAVTFDVRFGGGFKPSEAAVVEWSCEGATVRRFEGGLSAFVKAPRDAKRFTVTFALLDVMAVGGADGKPSQFVPVGGARSKTVDVAGGLPGPAPQPGPGPAPTQATSVTYVYEKDDTAVPPPVQAAINRLNRERKIVATLYEDDTPDGTGETPEQYKAPLAAAKAEGLPSLVVMAGDQVLRVVKSPVTEAEVMEAVP